MTDTVSTPLLRTLSEAECIDLLRRHRFGRLALGIEGWPAVLPVNYLFDDNTIVIRTSSDSSLREASMTTVAFEVDDADRFGHWGWSVLVQGPAFDVTSADDETSARLRSLPVRPWAPGIRDHWLKISVARISGRAFGDPIWRE